jgi:hypothetical protein
MNTSSKVTGMLLRRHYIKTCRCNRPHDDRGGDGGLKWPGKDAKDHCKLPEVRRWPEEPLRGGSASTSL